jgi:sugar fermentation stimulation protein A
VTAGPVRLSFPQDLAPARFVGRPNRFLVRARLEEDGQEVDAHLPDPGRLRELLLPDASLWLEPARNPDRKTRWTLRLCERPDKAGVVSLDTTLPNRLVEKALAGNALTEFADFSLVRSEYTVGRSRFDFLLERRRKRPASDSGLADAPGPRGGAGPKEEIGSESGAGQEERVGSESGAALEESPQNLLLEVKSVTLVEGGVGLFPDAVTERGARHVRELAELTRDGEWATAVLFVLQRDDAQEIQAASAIDPRFADELQAAMVQGVKVLGRRCRVTLDGITLGEAVPAGPG